MLVTNTVEGTEWVKAEVDAVSPAMVTVCVFKTVMREAVDEDPSTSTSGVSKAEVLTGEAGRKVMSAVFWVEPLSNAKLGAESGTLVTLWYIASLVGAEAEDVTATEVWVKTALFKLETAAESSLVELCAIAVAAAESPWGSEDNEAVPGTEEEANVWVFPVEEVGAYVSVHCWTERDLEETESLSAGANVAEVGREELEQERVTVSTVESSEAALVITARDDVDANPLLPPLIFEAAEKVFDELEADNVTSWTGVGNDEIELWALAEWLEPTELDTPEEAGLTLWVEESKVNELREDVMDVLEDVTEEPEVLATEDVLLIPEKVSELWESTDELLEEAVDATGIERVTEEANEDVAEELKKEEETKEADSEDEAETKVKVESTEEQEAETVSVPL